MKKLALKTASAMLGMLGAVLMTAGPVSATHDADVTDDENKCFIIAGKELTKAVAAEGKCVTKCQKSFRKDPVATPESNCEPPYAGATALCVTKAYDKAEAKLAACADCPNCYDENPMAVPATCAGYADFRVNGASQVRAQTAAFFSDSGALPLYCDDSGVGEGGISAEEAKCQDTTVGALGKFVAALGNCSAKCVKSEHKGTVAAGNCAPASDDEACPDAAEAKSAAKITGKCPVSATPACYVGQTGASWSIIVRAAVEGNYGATYCGS